MPIYEYTCKKCGKQSELLIRVKEKPECPNCGSKRLKRQFSSFIARAGGREGFEIDPAYYKEARPKYVKFRDGHREKYDPTRHC